MDLLKDTKKSFVQLTHKAAAGWIFFFLLVCAWMFALGIVVGRGTAPVHFNIDKLQNDLEALKETLIKKEQEKNKDLIDTLSKEPVMDFHENLKGIENNLKKAADALEVKKEQTPEKVSPEAVKKDPANAGAAVPEPALVNKPAADINQDTNPGKSFTIQVAAFKNQNEAETLVTTLKGKGYPAYTATGKTSDGAIWYRVRVGSFKEKSEASGILSNLAKEKRQGIVLEQ